MTESRADVPRLIVVGRNSKVWQRLLAVAPPAHPVLALSHADVAGHRFVNGDVVWIFSYSRELDHNVRLMKTLAESGATQCYYLSSATVNVGMRTRCFGYPRAKALAENAARQILRARVVRIGLIYVDPAELPAGTSAATALSRLSDTLTSGVTEEFTNLFMMVRRPFQSAFEHALYRLYGLLTRLAGPWPCALRPFDLLLKMWGMRWYGYVYLSNQLWLRSRSTTFEIMDPRG